ncbi:MAG: hypothetical protein OXF74_08345 [Rhodobacteraceae bacterium]|nr:hypothetical protein [Paracoccaceae bacterium]
MEYGDLSGGQAGLGTVSATIEIISNMIAAAVRLLRDDTVIHEGRLKTLKRFKDDVNEVQSGQECGMAFENYGDYIFDNMASGITL